MSVVRVSLDVTAVPERPSGAGRYVVELAAALVARDDVSLAMASRRGDADRWRAIGGARSAVCAVAPAARPLRLAWEQVALPLTLRRLGADVHHAPHYTMPEHTKVPVVVTVHDTTFFDHPEWHERSKIALFKRAITVAARRASVIVCVSETTAADLARVCKVSAPVVVAPHGVDHSRFNVYGTDDEGTLRRLGLEPGRPYILFLGTLEPRKDVATLIRAYGTVADELGDVALVVAGGKGWGDDRVARALAEVERHATRISLPGYVPDEAVPALLRRAAAVAYPSLAEGYGLPALEALACGAPLVTTSGTAMAEMSGEAAVVVPPSDPAALADALVEVVRAGRSDPEVLRRRDFGLTVAASLTWERSAALHVDAYRLATSGARS